MLKTEQAKKNEFKPFTAREKFLCDYAREIMLIAYEELRSPGATKGYFTPKEIMSNVQAALLTLKYEAKGITNRKMMKRLFWTARRM